MEMVGAPKWFLLPTVQHHHIDIDYVHTLADLMGALAEQSNFHGVTQVLFITSFDHQLSASMLQGLELH